MTEPRRDTKLGARFWLVVSASGALTAHSAAACNNTPLILPPACRPGQCTCEQDPTQPTCGGFDDRADGDSDPADANGADTSADGSAEGDASDDGPDAAD